jgi:hypothetical protein
MTDVELLTTDTSGNPIEGVRFPRDLGAARCEYEPYDPDSPGSLAIQHTFYRLDGSGRPIEGTLVEFYVPSDLLRDGVPTKRALRLVQRRMGWGRAPQKIAREDDQ